jgi:hypothetical protein
MWEFDPEHRWPIHNHSEAITWWRLLWEAKLNNPHGPRPELWAVWLEQRWEWGQWDRPPHTPLQSPTITEQLVRRTPEQVQSWVRIYAGLIRRSYPEHVYRAWLIPPVDAIAAWKVDIFTTGE